jgi:lipopolysaccharide/colanic/teichoic acid biosynthesis glycosyltransferase
MLLHRIRGLWSTYHGILAVILTVVFWSYLMVMASIFPDWERQDLQRFVLYNLAGVIGVIIAAIRGRAMAATLLAGRFVDCHTLALKQTVYIGVSILIVLLAAMDPMVSRTLRFSLLFGFLLVLYGVFLLCHLFLPKKLAEQLFSSEEHEQRTLLIGPVEKARGMAKWIEETAAFGFGMRGSVTDEEGEESRILHVTRVSDVAMLERIIRNEGIKQILLLEIPLDPNALSLAVNVANRAGVRLLIAANLNEICRHGIALFNLHNQTFIALRDEPLEDPVSRILKRTIDVVISVPVIIFVLPPLCLVVKIFQAIQSPGPLFKRQTCTSAAKRPFRIFKFRTTRVDQGDAASKPATADDLRIYPMGRILRQTGLEEVPQFLNVFFGDMSVVGPQPYTIVQNRRFSEVMDQYHVRTFAKPGITGLAQTNGFRGEAKNDEDIIERSKLDIEYIERWSLPLDFWIIFRTILQIFKPHRTLGS